MRTLALKDVPKLEVPERAPLAALEVTLVTRLFGGGAKTRELDEVCWLRPAALKSALRFWWRTGHAHLYDSLQALRTREEALFGTSATYGDKGKILGGPGVLEVEVAGNSGRSIARQPFKPVDGDAINIAYFSAAEQKKKRIPACVLALPDGNTRATITLHFSKGDEKDREEILDALRLFLVLGGVGSRTRRGAGALGLLEQAKAKAYRVPDSLAELKTFLLRWVKQERRQAPIPGLYSLGHLRAAFVGQVFKTAEEAHASALEVLREFRQARQHPPKWKGPADWGPTRWPEADAIRTKAGPKPHWKHQPKAANTDRYPRAALGLPIVVHYKDGPQADPDDFIVSGALPGDQGRWHRVNRFSSPLLLRPVRIWVGGAVRYVPVVVIGPYTLSSAVRPLVELTKGNGDPNREADRRTVVQSFSIDTAALTDVLPRLETAFSTALLSPKSKEKAFIRLI